MLKTIVKINSVTNLADARYCAGMGVEMLGFCLDENTDKYVEPKNFEEIRGWLAGVKIVGETQSADYQELSSLFNNYSIDILQISQPSLLPEIVNLNIPVILQLDFDSLNLKENLAKYADQVEFFLITVKEIDALAIYELEKIALNYKLMLSIPFDERATNTLLEKIPTARLAYNPSNFDELRDILESLETE